MNLAIIELGGKQYLVRPNSKLQVEKLSGNIGDTVKVDAVLLSGDGKDIKLGKPFVGAPVEAKILRQGRGKKITVFKYKAKSKYRRKQGHRQQFTEIEITKI